MDAALLRATESGRLADVLECLANGASVTVADHNGYSPLHFAAHRCNACVAEALVQSGAPVNARTFWGATPLHCAATNTACCALLLAAGADVNAAEMNGYTPLHRAAYFGAVDCALQLLAAGADVGAKNRWGQTPADVAVQRGHVAMPSLLCDAAAARARWSGLRRAALTAWCSPWHEGARGGARVLGGSRTSHARPHGRRAASRGKHW